MEEVEFETPAKMALCVARDSTPESEGRDILKRYRELVAQKSSERLLRSNEKRHESSVSSNIFNENNHDSTKGTGKNKENKINASRNSVKGEGKVTKTRNRVALKSLSVNIPASYNQDRRTKAKVVSDFKIHPSSVEKSVVVNQGRTPEMSISPINAESPLPRVNNIILELQEESRTINAFSDTNSVEQAVTTFSSNEGSPQNFSTIENNESIWVMAETGTDQIPIEHFDTENSYNINRDNDELSSTMSCACTSADSENSSREEVDNDEVQNFTSCVESSGAPLSPTSDSTQTFSIDGPSSTITPCSSSSLEMKKPSMLVSVSACNTTKTQSGVTVVPDTIIENNGDQYMSPQESASMRQQINKLNRQLEESRVQTEKESQRRQKCEERIAELSDQQELLKKNNSCSSDLAPSRISDSCSVSPASKAIAFGMAGISQIKSPGMSNSAATSLIERNKTLVKEVRFADQTCVELSERNASLKRDMQRLENNIDEIKSENESLHDAVVRSSNHGSKMEVSRDTIELKIREIKVLHEKDLEGVRNQLLESKIREESLSNKLEKSHQKKLEVELELASYIGKYEVLLKDHGEAKDKVSSLMERLTASQSTSELSAASAAESYREFCTEMQEKVEDLQQLAEDRLCMLTKERNERIKNEEMIEQMKMKDVDLEKGSYHRNHTHNFPQNNMLTPQKPIAESSLPDRTPTSNVLAKTLRSELKRTHDVTERVVEAEKIISVTQTKLKMANQELCESKSSLKCFKEQLRKCKSENATFHKREAKHDLCEESVVARQYDGVKFVPHSNLMKKILQTRSQYEEYKKQLNIVMEKIRAIKGEESEAINTGNLSEQSIRIRLLNALDQIINTSTEEYCHQDSNDSCLRGIPTCQQIEDSFEDVGSTISLGMVNKRMEYSFAPSEIEWRSQTGDMISPVSANKSPPSTPLEIAQFREEILNLQSQFDNAKESTVAVGIALNQASCELKTLMNANRDVDSKNDMATEEQIKMGSILVSKEDWTLYEETKLAFEQTTIELEAVKASYITCNERLFKELEHKAELEKSTNELNITIKSLIEELEAKTAELFEVRDEYEHISSHLSEVSQSNDHWKEQYEKIQHEVVNVRAENDAEYSIRQERERDLEECKNHLELTHEKLDETSQLLELKTYEVETIQSELDTASMKFEARMLEHSEQLKQLEIELERNTDELQLSKKEVMEKEDLLQGQSELTNEVMVELKKIKLNSSMSIKRSRKLEEDSAELRQVNDSLDRKCIKMREYIKNLTQKCEEWEICYQKQGKALLEVEEQNCHLLSKENQGKENSKPQSDRNSNPSYSDCSECKYLRKAITTESSALSILKKESKRKDIYIKSLTEQLKKTG